MFPCKPDPTASSHSILLYACISPGPFQENGRCTAPVRLQTFAMRVESNSGLRNSLFLWHWSICRPASQVEVGSVLQPTLLPEFERLICCMINRGHQHSESCFWGCEIRASCNGARIPGSSGSSRLSPASKDVWVRCSGTGIARPAPRASEAVPAGEGASARVV